MSAPNIATPSPIRTPSEGPYSLSERINIATRPIHSTLNRQILARLPLALPPHTTNPSTYVSGLLHVAPIYINFESLWQSLIEAPPLPTKLMTPFPLESDKVTNPSLDSKTIPLMTPPDSPLPELSRVCPRTQNLLAHLHLPGLLRSQRLRNDIRVLTGTPAEEIEQQLAVVSLKGKLAEFIAHTKQSVDAKPHVLLAYTWVLYMALFSGGRYLRASLKEAGGIGPHFWERDPSPIRPYSTTQPATPRPRASKSDVTESKGRDNTLRPSARSRSRSNNDTAGLVPGMEFFNFPGEYDGEDIKTLFKTRITEAEVLLTAGEKEDIIIEAQHIFTFMVSLISDLDTVMGTRDPDSSLKPPRPPVTSRDSIDLAQERIEKAKIDSLYKRLDGPQHSFAQVFITGPLQFANAFIPWEKILKPLGRKLSSKGRRHSPSVSFSAEEVQIPTAMVETHDLRGKFISVFLSFFTFLIVTIAWFLVT